MVRISQGFLMGLSIGMFLLISVFALVRAEKVVMPDWNEASQPVSENVQTFEVNNIKEAEKAVGYNVETIINLPNDFSRTNIAYIPISNTQKLVRQIFQSNQQGRVIFDQFPIETEQDTPSKFDKKEVISFEGKQVVYYYIDDKVFQTQWQTNGMAYKLHAVTPLQKSTMNFLVENIQ